MKKPSDPRHQRRRRIVQALFAFSFGQTRREDKLIESILGNLKRIDKVITRCAPEWPLEKIARMDLAILRLAVYELIIAKKEPLKVIIDEAVELGKEFGGETSPAFINGVLGTVMKKLNKKL